MAFSPAKTVEQVKGLLDELYSRVVAGPDPGAAADLADRCARAKRRLDALFPPPPPPPPRTALARHERELALPAGWAQRVEGGARYFGFSCHPDIPRAIVVESREFPADASGLAIVAGLLRQPAYGQSRESYAVRYRVSAAGVVVGSRTVNGRGSRNRGGYNASIRCTKVRKCLYIAARFVARPDPEHGA